MTGGLSSSNDPSGNRTADFNRKCGEESLAQIFGIYDLRHVHSASASILQGDLNEGRLHWLHFSLHDFTKTIALLAVWGHVLALWSAGLPGH